MKSKTENLIRELKVLKVIKWIEKKYKSHLKFSDSPPEKKITSVDLAPTNNIDMTFKDVMPSAFGDEFEKKEGVKWYSKDFLRLGIKKYNLYTLYPCKTQPSNLMFDISKSFR